MTSVNVTTTTNTVEVTTNGSTAVVTVPKTSVVSAVTQGPQGPAAPGFDIDSTAKVDRSVVYYDGAAGQFKADAVWTTSTLTFGGNF